MAPARGSTEGGTPRSRQFCLFDALGRNSQFWNNAEFNAVSGGLINILRFPVTNPLIQGFIQGNGQKGLRTP
jgi:hypothetical protein